ncbi:MAG: radical SAM protein [Candidatus Gracilibacteria bacterium]
MTSKKGKAEHIYINEIIRVNYKCNWSCKFCNVLKTNNYGEHDVSSKEVIYKVFALTKKYSQEERKRLILSFSGGEPTLNKNLLSFIKLAKEIGVGTVEIQTNGTTLFKNKEYILDLIEAGLDEIFLAQHSGDEKINKQLGSYYNISDFKDWVNYLKENKLDRKISIYLNIVVTKINLFFIYDYINLLLKIGFISLIPSRNHWDNSITRKISFGYCQPNGYAELNKNEVLLDFGDNQTKEVAKIVELCEKNNILPDFHFTSPPLCILDYKEYNLEYSRLKKLEENKKDGNVNKSNLESYKWLWKEKQKFNECDRCENNKYCLGFYNNWVSFVGEDYIREKINCFLNK